MAPIYIIGAGAIGKALAASLQYCGKEVYLVKVTGPGFTSLKETVTVLLPGNITISPLVNIIPRSEFFTDKGLIVLTTKSFVNAEMATWLQQAAPGCSLVLLQNGLGIEEPFIARGFNPVYRCVLFATSQPDDKGNIVFRPVKDSAIGIVKGNDTVLDDIVDRLRNPFFPFTAEKNIQPVIWKKAIVNSVFNSVCPLLETDNGIFYRNEAAASLAKRIIKECVLAAHAEGIATSEDEIMETLLQISRRADGLLISTLQDIRNGRETEIETLNFAISRRAFSRGLEEKVTLTHALGELTRLKAELFLRKIIPSVQ